jgi:hypothetical protein
MADGMTDGGSKACTPAVSLVNTYSAMLIGPLHLEMVLSINNIVADLRQKFGDGYLASHNRTYLHNFSNRAGLAAVYLTVC